MTALDVSIRSGGTLPADETIKTITQEGVKQKDLHEAWITLLDGRRLNVHLHKNADGEVLFNLVTNYIGLIEKDYFSLAFYEHPNIRKWLYKNKKISKQVKNSPWEFTLEVKFYVPDPRQLTEDFTRHLFTLQLRIDLYEARLPATFLNQAHLGSLIAQAELGDYKSDCQYYEALKGLNIVRTMTPELAEKVIHFYKDQKGKTPPEAELSFLLACREISMYGMAVYDAKENKKSVRIGINSSGISVFNDQLRVHYIIWQSMHQLEFQGKSFTIKLKPGEKEGKTSLTFKLADEGTAKRCWKTAVEHHTFFRLVQPDDKNRRSMLKFNSGQFRHEGRTLFQTQMASQMFDGTQATGPQVSAARLVSRPGEENVISHTEFSTSPLQHEEGNAPLNSSTTSYRVTQSPHDTTQHTTNGTHEIGKKSGKSSEKHESKIQSSTSSDSEEVEIQERHKVLHDEHDKSSQRIERTLQQSQELEHSPMFKTITNFTNDRNKSSSGPYVPANDNDGSVIRNERIEQVYRITGNGQAPEFDATDPETKPPRTTLQSWNETTVGPEQVTTEVDEHGNLIKKTVKTEQVKRTVQKQTYQSYTVGDDDSKFESQSPNDLKQTLDSIQTINSSIPTNLPAGQAHTRVLVYGRDGELREPLQSEQFDENQTVSSKIVTSGNRTIETITYKNKKDGVVHTNVEHRVTITGPEVDQDAELRRAIEEATGLNPKYEVQRIEIKEERLQ